MLHASMSWWSRDVCGTWFEMSCGWQWHSKMVSHQCTIFPQQCTLGRDVQKRCLLLPVGVAVTVLAGGVCTQCSQVPQYSCCQRYICCCQRHSCCGYCCCSLTWQLWHSCVTGYAGLKGFGTLKTVRPTAASRRCFRGPDVWQLKCNLLKDPCRSS